MQKIKIILICFWLLVISQVIYANQFNAKVIKVIDGDTLIVTTANVKMKIRLWGIDCPEYNQPYGLAAKKFTNLLCTEKIVTIRIIATDKYQRKVSVVLLKNNQSLNELLVKNGFAWWYEWYARDAVTLDAAQNFAKNNCLGLWQDQKPIKPWVWRLSQKSVMRRCFSRSRAHLEN